MTKNMTPGICEIMQCGRFFKCKYLNVCIKFITASVSLGYFKYENELKTSDKKMDVNKGRLPKYEGEVGETHFSLFLGYDTAGDNNSLIFT